MQTFDRLKLVADIDAIHIIDESQFEKIIKDGKTSSMKYHKKFPNLMIKIDYEDNEVVIEFTGKILGSRYIELISANNIKECFTNIERLGFCEFEIDMIMQSEVVSCDVTKDICYDNVKEMQSYIKSHITSYDKYTCTSLKNGNLILSKNVVTDRNKKRMTIYDKGKEMNKSDNLKFAKEHSLEGQYEGKCRFEINLNSKKQIREALGVEDNKLETVLASTRNPILDFFEDVVRQNSAENSVSDFKAYQYYLVLKDNDFNLGRLEAKVRELCSRGTSIKRMMEPYRKFMDSKVSEKTDIYTKVIEQLR